MEDLEIEDEMASNNPGLFLNKFYGHYYLFGNRSFRQRVSSPTTSSLILKSIRQRLIEGTINTVNRSLCNLICE